MIRTATRRLRLVSIWLWLLYGCSGVAERQRSPTIELALPQTGATEFVSVDTTRAASFLASMPSGGAREVVVNSLQSGGPDPYVSLSDHRVLQLNRYRGLQVLDLSAPEAPRVEGRLSFSGKPVALYVAGDVAYVVLADHSERSEAVLSENTLLLTIDLEQRSQPVLIEQATIAGTVRNTHFVPGDSSSQLFIVVDQSDDTERRRTSLVKYVATAGALEQKGQLDLGEAVSVVDFTSKYAIVAKSDSAAEPQHSTLALIDIASSAQELALGREVALQSQVDSYSQLDLRGTILRVFSAHRGPGTENSLETFEVSDSQKIERLAACSVDDSRSFDVAWFTEHTAFIRVVDGQMQAVLVFSIDAKGQCSRVDDLMLPVGAGLRVTQDETRLITITDQKGDEHTLDVSIYALAEPNDSSAPLARQTSSFDSRFSSVAARPREASLLEGAVSMVAEDGTPETNLLVVPFDGHNGDGYVEAVQLFSFSNKSVTRRGFVLLDTHSPRAFVPDVDPTSNRIVSLDVESLRVFQIGAAEPLQASSRVEIAPDYSHVFVYGDYSLRVRRQDADMGPNARVEIAPLAAATDDATVQATLELPGNAQLRQVGDLLVVVSSSDAQDMTQREAKKPVPTSISIFDLTEPTAPKMLSTLSSDRLAPVAAGRVLLDKPTVNAMLPLFINCPDCTDSYGDHTAGIYALGQALVFAGVHEQHKSLGWWVECTWRPREPRRPCGASAVVEAGCSDTWLQGESYCGGPEGQKSVCGGEIKQCTREGCEPAMPDGEALIQNCIRQEKLRSWNSYYLQVLDVSDPQHPQLSEPVELPVDDEATSMLVAGDKLYINYQRPIESSDITPLVRRYVRTLSLTEPKSPFLSEGVNVPGEVLAVDGDVLVMRDRVWKEQVPESVATQVKLRDNIAELTALASFDDAQITNALFDGSGHVLLGYVRGADRSSSSERMLLLDANDLSELNHLDFGAASNLTRLSPGRVAVSEFQEVSVIHTDDAADPHVDVDHLSTGSAHQLALTRDEDALLIAAGRYGIHRVELRGERMQ